MRFPFKMLDLLKRLILLVSSFFFVLLHETRTKVVVQSAHLQTLHAFVLCDFRVHQKKRL